MPFPTPRTSPPQGELPDALAGCASVLQARGAQPALPILPTPLS